MALTNKGSYFGMTKKTAERNTVLVPATVGANNIIDPKYVYGDDVPTGDNKYLDETQYYEYDAAATEAKNPATVLVKDNNSTIINVYYSRKIFEIRYIYARSYTSNNWWETTTTTQIATDTKDGKLTSWSATNVSAGVPSLKTGYTQKTEVWTNSGTTSTMYYVAVRAEYGANIEDLWPSSAVNSVNGYTFGSWGAQDGTRYRIDGGNAHANIVGPYPYMSAEMIRTADVNTKVVEDGQTYYVAQRMSAWWGGSNANISSHTYHIFMEVLTGQEIPAGAVVRTRDNGKTYILVETHDFTCAHNGNTRVDPFDYIGYECINDTRFKADGSSNIDGNTDYQKNSENYENTTTNKNAGRYDCPETTDKCKYCNCFYYDRIDGLDLIFQDQNGNIHVDQDMTYGDLLENGAHEDWVDHVPQYPTDLEPDAYEFTGWYTTPELFDGTQVDLAEGTMPPSNLVLYAGWKLKTHTVEIYPDYSSMVNGTGQIGETLRVLHGETVPDDKIPETPTREGVEFIQA